MGGAAPPGPPSLEFHPSACACMVILQILVSVCDSIVSQRDRAGYTCDKVESRIFKLQYSHGLVIKSGISCDQHVSSKIEQESWFV